MYYAIKFIMFEHLSKTYLLILLISLARSCKHAVNWAHWVLSSNIPVCTNQKIEKFQHQNARHTG